MPALARACLVAAVVVFGATMVGMKAVAKPDRAKEPRSGLIVAATRIRPSVGGKTWAFHVINATPKPIESILLEEVSYEWNTEVRTSVHLVVRGASGARRLMAEFPSLYDDMPRHTVRIPILGRTGLIAAEL